MARQTYKQLKVPPEARVSLAQLFSNNAINSPAGEVSFGDQTNLPALSGSTIPTGWAREQVEDFTSVFLEASGGECWISVTVL